MDESVSMVEKTVTQNTRAIVCFGPATPTTGNRAGEYFQVTIDPNMVSNNGQYIRFGQYAGDEIQGWQRVSAMTVVCDLGKSNARLLSAEGYEEEEGASITLRFLE